ncbi:OmpA-OmpF porin, OOP family [Franzmannia pantelleriensis]|uniref:OmpA-OmpF porin, OOP family n=1 Tax=Franzmannia pantelleriensis TaxID=48727 RepID=A0A1G9FBE0_9GAMM|nr:OmpA family protein [Halomonas pantelleriensis]SDK85676.1 OmpA-OmpF porin, OOP family [Halomonas pantelleriensis]
MKKSTTGLLIGSALALGLAGCATSGPTGGQTSAQMSGSSSSADRAWYQHPAVCGVAGGLIGGSIGYATAGSSDEEQGGAIGFGVGSAAGALLCADRTPEPQPQPEPEPMPEPEPEPEPEFEPVVLSSEVTFAFDSAELRPEASMTLDEVAHRLRENTDLRVNIDGHTDSVGNPQYNQGLSQRRADSVRDYLVSQGIAENRMRTRGFGEERPVATNETDEGRAQNRRVEIDRQ